VARLRWSIPKPSFPSWSPDLCRVYNTVPLLQGVGAALLFARIYIGSLTPHHESTIVMPRE
jgi:hypothetical protein